MKLGWGHSKFWLGTAKRGVDQSLVTVNREYGDIQSVGLPTHQSSLNINYTQDV